MARLTAYLVRQFSFNALAFALVASVLFWLIQCLRLFDVVSVKGQNLLTLFGQALLTMPPLLIVFLYVCFGIGLARALRDLQGSQELPAIHASRRFPALIRAILVYGIGSAVLVLGLSNFLDPWSKAQLDNWDQEVAADLVSRTLVPHRFSEVVPGVVIRIGGRHGNGDITDFFADDRRDPETRRSYVAETATISSDGEGGYLLNLRDGFMQYASSAKELSQVSFKSYDVSMARFTEPLETKASLSELNSFEIISAALHSKKWSASALNRLAARSAEGLRVLAMCLLVAGLAAFPSGRRSRFGLPIEVIVLAAAFIERGISTYAPLPSTVQPFGGAIVLLIVSILLLAVRLRVFRRGPRQVRRAALRQVPA